MVGRRLPKSITSIDDIVTVSKDKVYQTFRQTSLCLIQISKNLRQYKAVVMQKAWGDETSKTRTYLLHTPSGKQRQNCLHLRKRNLHQTGTEGSHHPQMTFVATSEG
ncbi:hypothetical protein ElyMa_006901200 [Elysia marginata]|uniref:Uncharacterized protein n=1 Tax=Elysia marginata TaxID=1093978 RepID=A0AAV4JDS0_9GAST|nr:hypothetical protein ElyMa_006901200 [Elysia marginata]